MCVCACVCVRARVRVRVYDCEVEGHSQSGWNSLVDTLMHVMCLPCGPVCVLDSSLFLSPPSD